MSTFDVKIEFNGKIYKGRAEIDRNVLTIHGFGLGVKSTQVSSHNELQAEILLKELAESYELKKTRTQ